MHLVFGCQRCGRIQAQTSATTNPRPLYVHSCSPTSAINGPLSECTALLKDNYIEMRNKMKHWPGRLQRSARWTYALLTVPRTSVWITQLREGLYRITSIAFSTCNLQTDCKTAGELMLIYKLLLTDRSWRCAELSTMVTDPQPFKLPYVCTQGDTGGKNYFGEFSALQDTNNAASLPKVSTSLISRLVKYVHVDGGMFEQVREQM